MPMVVAGISIVPAMAKPMPPPGPTCWNDGLIRLRLAVAVPPGPGVEVISSVPPAMS